MRYTLRQLEYFAALVRHENFGRAADACNVSQPALSTQIRALEDAMGGALVERRARSIVLTPHGRQMLPMVQAVLEAAQRLDEAGQADDGLQGVLSLGLIPTVAPYLLPGTLASIRARDISLRIDVREAQTDALLEALAAGELDAAVIAVPDGRAGLVEEPLFEDRFLLASAAGVGGRPERIRRPTELGAQPLMLLEDGHCLTDQALDVCGRTRAQAGIHTNASSLATLVRLVEAGFGQTLLPEIAASAESKLVAGLHLQRFASREPARTIGLVRRAASAGGAWFGDLATILSEVGVALTQEARQTFS